MEEDKTLIKVHPNSHYLSINRLSHGEQNLSIIEISIAIAKLSSEYNSTLLIIDYEIYSSLDSNNLKKLFEILKSDEHRYQLILNYPSLTIRDDWCDYNLINIFEENNNIKVKNVDD